MLFALRCGCEILAQNITFYETRFKSNAFNSQRFLMQLTEIGLD